MRILSSLVFNGQISTKLFDLEAYSLFISNCSIKDNIIIMENNTDKSILRLVTFRGMILPMTEEQYDSFLDSIDEWNN